MFTVADAVIERPLSSVMAPVKAQIRPVSPPPTTRYSGEKYGSTRRPFAGMCLSTMSRSFRRAGPPAALDTVTR